MALLCTVLVSVWITWIFLIHLSVKVMVMMVTNLGTCDDDDDDDDVVMTSRALAVHTVVRQIIFEETSSVNLFAKD